MPRGRHRHSPPLHRLLPPLAVAGASVLCAAGAWLVAEPVVLRSLVALAAAAAVTGSVLMRSWDRAAGRRVAELTRARASDQWKNEERVAELEADLEESRELRTKLETKLRAKRVELAGLRGEHAALLRRYATAETERASALEGRRQLELEASAPAKALPASPSTPTASVYLRAAQALENLSKNAAEQEKHRAAEQTREQDRDEPSQEDPEPAPKSPAPKSPAPKTRAEPALPARRPAPAVGIVPDGPRRRPSKPGPEGGFDFFGTGDGALPPGDAPGRSLKEIEAAEQQDLADVVGEEALASHRRDNDSREVGKVIDLTAHDETEQLDVAELRTAIS
ncbi:hypothetical protein QCN29_01920 [Streptomyces sp. HNM0663]|uniref:Secreted protein n=1 Tax=Streptomyces chengmaiensis TaxID=3040919 RepID=A0ABT6HHP2_9ACTN|nr:hypothetical protein [Streptomyces chengmaiensis]MDH2387564.1 hypothetical protein [Streptomyces chengmaiensis]